MSYENKAPWFVQQSFSLSSSQEKFFHKIRIYVKTITENCHVLIVPLLPLGNMMTPKKKLSYAAGEILSD